MGQALARADQLTGHYEKIYADHDHVGRYLRSKKMLRAQQLIAENVLGKIITVVSIYHTWYDSIPGSGGSWRVEKALSGNGVLWDMGPHRFDLLVGLFGMPSQVWAVTETLAHGYQASSACPRSPIQDCVRRARRLPVRCRCQLPRRRPGLGVANSRGWPRRRGDHDPTDLRGHGPLHRRYGRRPVFADIGPRTYNLDPAAAEARITPRTRVILPVHMNGMPADTDVGRRSHGPAVIIK